MNAARDFLGAAHLSLLTVRDQVQDESIHRHVVAALEHIDNALELATGYEARLQVRLPAGLLERVESAKGIGGYPTTSAVIRAALDAFLQHHRIPEAP